MTKRFLLPLVASLAVLGAGCAPASVPPVTAPPSETPPVNAPPTATPPVPAPPASTSTPVTASTAVTSETLAFPGILPAAQVDKKILIKTTLGDIEIQLDSKLGPRAASNFVYLVQHHFYDGTIFHRVIPSFMIQGGDPTGTGTGGPGYQFDNDPVSVPYTDGIVAMANAGPNTNGSQFFIMVADTPLPPDYSVFGRVISGLDVAHKIAAVPRDSNDRPNDDVKMVSVTAVP